MITLTVISFNGTAPAQRLAATFGELGGSIGRADTNQLVLPDRTVSRLHAQIVCRQAGYAVIDRGANRLALNGRTVASGVEAPLQSGDQLQIGDYCIAVEAAAPGVPVAKEAAGGFGFGFDRPVAPSPPLPGIARQPASASPGGWSPPDAPRAAVPGAWPQHARPDRDIGLNESEKAPSLLGGAIPGLPSAPEQSIGALFGLSPAAPGSLFANSVFEPPAAQPNTYGDADPQRALARTAPPVPAPIGDNVPDHALPFPARAEAPAVAPPSGGVFVNSWDAEPRITTMIKPVAQAPRAEPVVPPPPAPPPAPAFASAAPAGEAALLAALQEGLATSDLPLDRLTPDLMRLIGQLLREAVQGSVDLLMARRELKTEFHAETTAIRPDRNNPLKYSPTAEIALGYLLKPPVRGFVPGAVAMRGAYDDLRAHQYGMVAGMHAALQGVLQRFDPAVLESRLGQQSMLSNLLPAHRKARLWEVYTRFYAEISSEACDDFDRLLGTAFLRAYDAHLDDRKKDEE